MLIFRKCRNLVFIFCQQINYIEKENNNFPAGYVGSFYRNLADNVDNGSDFFSRITADADIPREDV